MSIESESRRIFNESHSEVLRLRAENTQLRAELNEEAVLNGKGSEREAALLAKVERLERKIAALRADKARLDWLHCTADGIKWQTNNTNLITREAIDLARKEAKS